jgi:outer membrane protease
MKAEMKLKALSIPIVIACLFLAVPIAAAQTVDKNRSEVTRIGEKVSAEIYGGYLFGQSRELVFDAATGHKVSELFWKIDGAFVLGGALTVRPVEWLTLKVDAWTPVQSRNTMDDYDWIVDGRADWSHWSHHPDTKMNRGHRIDVGAAVRLAKFAGTPLFDSAQLNLLAGYRWVYMNWTSFGGTYTYSSSTGFRDRTGTFPEGVPGIGYEQWLETPYIGLGGHMTVARWSFSGELTGSLWTRGSARDHHYMRSLMFEDESRSMPMIAGEVKAGYALTDRLSLFGSALFQRYFETKAATTTTDFATGTVSHEPGEVAGMDHYALLFNLGLKWAF